MTVVLTLHKLGLPPTRPFTSFPVLQVPLCKCCPGGHKMALNKYLQGV